MSRIKSKDTGLEVQIRSELHKRGLRFRKHVKELPGRPDIVFSKARVVVFVDGDFWHGYKFQLWKHNVSGFWKKKISKNRKRDINNKQKLCDMGWVVIRLWQHEIHEDFETCINRVVSAVQNQL
jgi:DNA mismatch endonuclease (patch repair protein)